MLSTQSKRCLFLQLLCLWKFLQPWLMWLGDCWVLFSDGMKNLVVRYQLFTLSPCLLGFVSGQIGFCCLLHCSRLTLTCAVLVSIWDSLKYTHWGLKSCDKTWSGCGYHMTWHLCGIAHQAVRRHVAKAQGIITNRLGACWTTYPNSKPKYENHIRVTVRGMCDVIPSGCAKVCKLLQIVLSTLKKV